MKYYSEKLAQLFDDEESLFKAEKAADELSKHREERLAQIIACTAEFEKKLAAKNKELAEKRKEVTEIEKEIAKWKSENALYRIINFWN